MTFQNSNICRRNGSESLKGCYEDYYIVQLLHNSLLYINAEMTKVKHLQENSKYSRVRVYHKQCYSQSTTCMHTWD